MTAEQRHALTEAAEKLHKAGDKLTRVSHEALLVAQHYHRCAHRIESLGQLDTESSEALADAVRLLNGSTDEL
jgi:hypothetical protein